MSQHTPVPWRLSKRQISPQGILSDDWGPIAEAVGGYSAEEKDANMRHIVHCVNTHDQLLAALVAQEEAERAKTQLGYHMAKEPSRYTEAHRQWCDEYHVLVEVSSTSDFKAKRLRTAALKAGEAEAGGWRPIETAPKDGTTILAILACENWCLAAVEWQEGVNLFGEPREGWVCIREVLWVEPAWWTPIPQPLPPRPSTNS